MAAQAARQHGVLTHAQLRSLGLSADAIRHRVAQGRMRRLHRGVYLVGSVAPPLAAEMAAVLACGPGAVLSHRSAAALWGLVPTPATPAPCQVTVPGRNPGAKPGIRIHRVVAIHPSERRVRHRVPVTSPARTMVDFSTQASEAALEQALAQAYARRIARRQELAAALARARDRGGTRQLRAMVEGELRPALLRSTAERRFLALVPLGRLPPPEPGVRVGGYEVDFLWREERLIVELDGFRFHGSRPAFERDRLRDAELQAQGYHVMRVTWRQLVREPEAVLVRVAQVLARLGSGAF